MSLRSELNLMNCPVGYIDFSYQRQNNGVDFGPPITGSGAVYGFVFATNILTNDTLNPMPFNFGSNFNIGSQVYEFAPDNYTLDIEIALVGDLLPCEITVQFSDYNRVTEVTTPRSPYVITLTAAAPVWTDTLSAATDSDLIYDSESWRCPV